MNMMNEPLQALHERCLPTLTTMMPEPLTPPIVESSVDIRERLREEFSDELADVIAMVKTKAAIEANQHLEKLQQQLENRYAMAFEKRQQSIADSIARLQQTIELAVKGVESCRNELIRDVESGAIEIAFMAVVKILGQHAADRRLIREIIHQAILDMGNAELLKIRLSSDDFNQMSDETSSWGKLFVEDTSLSPGDCFIETSRHSLEAGVNHQLRELKRCLLMTFDQG